MTFFRRAVLILAAILSLSASITSAQPSVSYYGYSTSEINTATSSLIEPQWALAGIKGRYTNSKFPGKLTGHFEYDLLNQAPTRAHALYRVSTGETTSISVLAGQYLSPTAFLHPSGQWIRVPRRAATIAGSQIAPTGIAGWFNWDNGVARVSVSNHRDGQTVTGAITLRGVSAFRSTGGYGLMAKKRLHDKWLNFWAGVINHNSNVSRDAGAFLQHYFEFGNVRLYTQVDVFQDGETDTSWFAGASVKLREYWFIGAFYKQGPDGADQAVLRLQFHLGN